MHFVPFDARESYSIRSSTNRAACVGSEEIRIPSAETKAGIVDPWTEVRETHAVVQRHAARYFPGIGRIKLRRQVTECRDDVEVLLGIRRGLADQHVRIGI